MNMEKLQQLLASPNRITTLSTVAQQGNPNSAVFGSAKLHDGQIVIGTGNNRSLQNLLENPKATLMIIIPGDSIIAFQGARLYLKCTAIEESGELLELLREEAGKKAGRTAARMIKHVLRFEIIDERPLVDMSSLIPG